MPHYLHGCNTGTPKNKLIFGCDRDREKARDANKGQDPDLEARIRTLEEKLGVVGRSDDSLAASVQALQHEMDLLTKIGGSRSRS